MKIQWSESEEAEIGSYVTMKTLAGWLNKKAEAAVNRMILCGECPKGKDKNGPEKKSKVLVTAEAVLKSCNLCNSIEHMAKDCGSFVKASVDQRRKILASKKLCFLCLGKNHSAPECRKKQKCRINDCGKKHHEMLHKEVEQNVQQTEANPSTSVTVNGQGSSSATVSGNHASTSGGLKTSADVSGKVVHVNAQATVPRMLMKILPVYVTGPKGTIKVYAFLDEGSTITMVKDTLSDRMGLTGPNRPLKFQGASGLPQIDNTSKSVEMKIRGTFSHAREYTLYNVRTIKGMGLPKQTVNVQKLAQDWRFLSERPVEDMAEAEPEILIGLDNVALITSREVIHGPWDAPYLARTLLGWVIMGKVVNSIDNVESNYTVLDIERTDDLYEMVKESFSTEAFGVKSNMDTMYSREDRKALKYMQKHTKRASDGRFEAGLLWKESESPKMPESRQAAFKRLQHTTEKKLDRDKELAEAYCQKIDEHLQKGYLKKLEDVDRQIPMEKVWYIPHFPIFHPAKKKLRIVFDCAARSNGVALNDVLVKGPDLLKPLPAVLGNFRRGRYAFMGDIREMFHRVHVKVEDQNYQRILWRGMERKIEPEEYKLTVLTFGANCSPALASYAKEVNAKDFQEEYPEAVQEILNHTYCDDYLGTSETTMEAQKLISDVVKVFKSGGFDIVNWCANDMQVLKNLAQDQLSAKVVNFETNVSERVLGMLWLPSEDVFTFKVNFRQVPADILSGERLPTMREVLRLIMSIFDPLGFIAVFTVKGKIFLQEMWKQKLGWDTEISGDLVIQWRKFLKDLKEIEEVKVPRYFSVNLPKAHLIELHVFGDASEKAFAEVAYLRIVFDEGSDVSLVCARSRVAPLKQMSIPRMELQAAVLCVRLAKTIREFLEVKIDNVVFWSDSMTVLKWIRNDNRRFKDFVAHRLGEIEENSEVKSWRWVPTKMNVADLATRASTSDLSPESVWFLGPSFLKKDSSQWPVEKCSDSQLEDDEVEIVKTIIKPRKDVRYPLPDVKRFSKWWRLLRATAQVRNIANFWLQKVRDRLNHNSVKRVLPSLTVEHICEAESEWYKEAQSEYHGLSLTDKKSRVYGLSPFYDYEGVLRMNSRLTNSEFPGKFPIILPPKHKVTRLLIMESHERHLHCGREQVLNDLRLRFYIPQMRAAVRKTWHDCQYCRNRRAQVSIPEMAPLPEARVSEHLHAFTHTGMDYFGPLYVTVGRHREKRWGVIFTCMASRAVHLEIAYSLTTDSAIMAIRRFLCRRGPVRHIYCDNGTNLRGASVEMRTAVESIDDDKVREDLLRKMIEFHFIPPAAPHMGGSWERLIRSVKNNLDVILKEQFPTDEVLQTLFTEIEGILNNRPLTHVSVDPDDQTALTPNHLLLGGALDNTQPGEFTDRDMILRKAWRKSQRLADMFWKRWSREYLPQLAKRSKWHDQGRQLQVGDVVLVTDENGPRNQWPLAIVIEVRPGKDGKIRTVVVQTTKGKYCRPVTKIVPLDVGADRTEGECEIFE